MRLLLATLGLVAGCGELLGLDPVEAPTAQAPELIRSMSDAHGQGEGDFSEIKVSLPSAARGDLIVVAVCFVNGTIASVSDPDTPAYTELASKGAAGELHAELFWAAVATTRAGFEIRVLFANGDPGSSPDMRVAEYRNVMFPDPIDNATVNEAADTASLDLEVMVSQVPSLVFAAICSGTQAGDVSNFTLIDKTSPNGDAIAQRSVSSIGPITATAKQDPSGAMIFQLVAIKGGTPL